MNTNSITAPAIRRANAGWRHALGIACFVLCGRASAAAPADEIVALAPWEVNETAEPSDTARVRASAWVPAEAWSGRAVGTLADALRFVPGAILQESFGGFEPPRLSIRGSGVQSAPSSRGLALLLEGLPLGLADGSFNSALFDPQLGAGLEVQRGLDGWRTAPATSGGALDLQGWRDAETGVATRVEAGAFGARRAGLGGRLTRGGDQYALAATAAEQEGFRAHSGQQRRALFATAARAIATTTRAEVSLYHAHARYDVPGPLTLAALLSDPRGVSSDVRRDAPARASTLTRVAFSGAHATAERTFEAGVALARTDDDFRQLQANGVSVSRSDDLHARVAFSGRFTTGSFSHRVRAAATASLGRREVERFTNQAGARGTLFGRDRLRPATATFLVEDEFPVARHLTGSIGLAHVSARRDIEDRLQAPTGATTRHVRSDTELPQASLRWRPAPGLAVFGSVSQAIEPPTFDDLIAVAGTPPLPGRRSQALAPQRALTYELGARAFGPKLTWDLAVYRAEWRDEILRLADERGAARGAVNAGPTTHEGIEASVRWRLLERGVRLSLEASAVWTRFAFDRDPVYGSARLAGLPPHLGAAELVAEYPRSFYAGLGADWTQGDTRVDHAGRLRYGGRTLAHARLGWRSAPYWTLFVDVRNLFDHASIASTAGVLDLARNPAATAIFLPAPGRAWTIGVAWRN